MVELKNSQTIKYQCTYKHEDVKVVQILQMTLTFSL